jgi:WD40 repeat protein
MQFRELLLAVALASVLSIHAQQHPSKIWSVLTPNHSIREADISPDGQVVATGGMAHNIQLRKTRDGSLVTNLPAHDNSVVAVQFSSDNSLLASVSRDEGLKLWSPPEMILVGSTNGIVFGTSANESAIAFSPDDSLLVTQLKNSTTNIAIWSLDHQNHSQHLLHSLSNTVELHAAEFSPDGSTLATAGGIRGQDTTVKIWNPTNGSLLATLQTSNTYGIDDLAFSPDGTLLATGTSEFGTAQLELWNTSDWTLRLRLATNGFALEFTPDGNFLISLRSGKPGSESYIDVWQVASGALIRTYQAPFAEYGQLATLNITPDGHTILLGAQVNKDGQAHGQLTAIRNPLELVEIHHSDQGIQLNWLQSTTNLQSRSDLQSPWVNLIAPLGGATVTNDSPSRYFRLKPQAP